jgi:hypothetical protein
VLVGAGWRICNSRKVAKGFEQLGSHGIVVRLGGIYALEGVMNTSDLELVCVRS